jgi:hypothetical protein
LHIDGCVETGGLATPNQPFIRDLFVAPAGSVIAPSTVKPALAGKH